MALLSSCAVHKYTPPNHNLDITDNIEINLDFETVWEGTIERATASFFDIDNFEKDSGLLTLSFGTGSASEFVDCGQWDGRQWNGSNHTFTGPYATYLETFLGGNFTGRMKVFIKSVSDNKTTITLNAHYVLETPSRIEGSGIYETRVPAMNWAFETGGSATRKSFFSAPNSPSTRTCRPTGKAEKAILGALKG